jgi:acylphosphatase
LLAGLEPGPVLSHPRRDVKALLRLRIEGRVQGVGFRWFVAREARALGLAGRVRNCSDGAVELEAEGRDEALRELLEAVRRGPSASRVQHVHETWGTSRERFRGFEIVD